MLPWVFQGAKPFGYPRGNCKIWDPYGWNSVALIVHPDGSTD